MGKATVSETLENRYAKNLRRVYRARHELHKAELALSKAIFLELMRRDLAEDVHGDLISYCVRGDGMGPIFDTLSEAAAYVMTNTRKTG